MDATRLIEEAGRLSERATPGPWRVGTVHAAEEVWAAYPEGLAGLASERLLLRLNPNFTSEQDTTFIARARTLVPDLAAALKVSEERARKAEDEEEELRELVARYQEASGIDVGGDPGGVTPEILSKFIQSEEARANAAEKQCAELTAANLAANKRIVELEHERDAAKRQISALENQLVNAAALRIEDEAHCERLIAERDAARAELAHPYICPNCTAKLRRLDRMDAAGHAAYELDKARKDAAGQNKRAQKAEQEAKELRAELARLTTPRPIAEAPRDGTWVLCKCSAGWKEGQFCGLNFDPPNCLGWFGRDNRELRRVTEYLPLPEVKP